MTISSNRISGVLLTVGLMASGCSSSAQMAPVPPPRRPPENKTEAVAKSKLPEDCEPTDIRSLPASLSYRERSIVEAKNLADQGFELLKRSESPKLPRPEREENLNEAVERFLTALKADPYNVHATYNLAAAYARIDRAQCSVNLLDRMAALHKLPSQHEEVEDKLDRLLGRNRYRNAMDPDFRTLRELDSFRAVVRKFHQQKP